MAQLKLRGKGKNPLLKQQLLGILEELWKNCRCPFVCQSSNENGCHGCTAAPTLHLPDNHIYYAACLQVCDVWGILQKDKLLGPKLVQNIPERRQCLKSSDRNTLQSYSLWTVGLMLPWHGPPAPCQKQIMGCRGFACGHPPHIVHFSIMFYKIFISYRGNIKMMAKMLEVERYWLCGAFDEVVKFDQNNERSEFLQQQFWKKHTNSYHVHALQN